MSITALALLTLVVGYFVYNHGSRGRKMNIAFNAVTGRTLMTNDVNPTVLKKRVVQILVNNTMDLNILNNVMHHVLNKIDADMQSGGILYGLIVERSVGRIDRKMFNNKLAEYVKNVSATLSIPLMNKDRGTGSFVRRYLQGGGGSGGTHSYEVTPGGYNYGTLYGRARNYYGPPASVYGYPARLTKDKLMELQMAQAMRS